MNRHVPKFLWTSPRRKQSQKKMSRATHATWTISWKMLSMKNVYKGQSSWCSFNWNKAIEKSSHLFIKHPVLKPVFDKLGSKGFLAA